MLSKVKVRAIVIRCLVSLTVFNRRLRYFRADRLKMDIPVANLSGEESFFNFSLERSLLLRLQVEEISACQSPLRDVVLQVLRGGGAHAKISQFILFITDGDHDFLDILLFSLEWKN